MLAHAGPDLILGHRGTKPRRQSDGDGDDFQDIKELAARVVTFSQFLGRHDKEALLRIFAEGRPVRRATYHDSCHHKHVLRASEDSRTLVRMALRTELLEMTGPAACCGFAGAYSVDHPEVAEALLADKLAAVTASGADLVALDCPGCLLQIRGGCARSGPAVEIRHTAEIVAAALEND